MNIENTHTRLMAIFQDYLGKPQWCIAKNGGGYTQKGMAKGLKVHCLFMITEVSIRCQKTRRLVYAVYPRIPPQYTTGKPVPER